MSLKKTFVFLVLFAVGLLFVYQVELPRERKEQAAQQPFLDVKPEDLTLIEIKSAQQKISLNHNRSKEGASKGGEWNLADLPKSKLDRATVNGLVSALLDLSLEEKIAAEESADPEIFGLKDPAVTIDVAYNGNRKELLIGKKNDFLEKRYLQIAGGSEVYLIDDALFLAATKERNDFRSSSPISFIDSDIASLVLSQEETQLQLDSKANLEWVIVKPASYSASDRAVADLTRTLRNLKAKNFFDNVEKDLGKFGLLEPEAQIKIVFKADKQFQSLEVDFGKSKQQSEGSEQVYIKLSDDPTVYQLESNPLKQLFKPVEELREKQLFEFAVDDVIGVEWQHKDGRKIVLTKDQNRWSVNDSSGDVKFIEDFLRSLSEIKAESFPEESRDFGFGAPEISVLVTIKQNDHEPQQRKLFIGSQVADTQERYAAVDDLSEPFILSADSIKKISPRAESLVQPEISPTAKSNISGASKSETQETEGQGKSVD